VPKIPGVRHLDAVKALEKGGGGAGGPMNGS
jgi:hypothetical protein